MAGSSILSGLSTTPEALAQIGSHIFKKALLSRPKGPHPRLESDKSLVDPKNCNAGNEIRWDATVPKIFR